MCTQLTIYVKILQFSTLCTGLFGQTSIRSYELTTARGVYNGHTTTLRHRIKVPVRITFLHLPSCLILIYLILSKFHVLWWLNQAATTFKCKLNASQCRLVKNKRISMLTRELRVLSSNLVTVIVLDGIQS